MSGDAAGCASSLESLIDVARLQQIFDRSLKRLTVSKNSRLARLVLLATSFSANLSSQK